MIFQIHRHTDVNANMWIWTRDTGYFSDNDKACVDTWFMGPGECVAPKDLETKTDQPTGRGQAGCRSVGVCARQQRRHEDTHTWPPDPDAKRNDLGT